MKQSFTYLALGDSYTIGECVTEEERFPNQFANRLRTEGIAVDEVKIVAQTGWTTDELQQGIAASGLTANDRFDMVSLLIGVNNQYRGRAVENYITEFKALLEQAIQFAGGHKDHVFVVSIPDYAFTPFGKCQQIISDGIDLYNTANKAIADSMGVAYINITPISREGLNDTSLVASDGLHPSGKQYELWVKLMPNYAWQLGMTIQKAQQTVDSWIKTIGIRYFNELTNTAILMEEVGEVARLMSRLYGEQSFKTPELAASAKDDLADEMADVLFVLICLANQTGVNLSAALEKNLEKKTTRDRKRHSENEKLRIV